MVRSRFMHLSAALLVITLVAAACGGGGDDETADPTTTTTTEAPTTTEPTPDATTTSRTTTTTVPDPTGPEPLALNEIPGLVLAWGDGTGDPLQLAKDIIGFPLDVPVPDGAARHQPRSVRRGHGRDLGVGLEL